MPMGAWSTPPVAKCPFLLLPGPPRIFEQSLSQIMSCFPGIGTDDSFPDSSRDSL